MSEADRLFLEAAVELAEQGRFTCAPNPAVGCIIVKDQVVRGRGFHRQTGGPHAEVNAIEMAGGVGNIAGATVYISLEPCAFEGRTPACAETLVAANVSRVVVAATDPHSRVAGQGLQILRDAGIQADLIELPSARHCIEGYASRIARNRPFVRIKTASSLDGATALASGESQWITGPEARVDVQYWRARSDAIVTGIGTVVADDPALTVRDTRFGDYAAPLRVVLDSRLRIARDAGLLDGSAPTLLVHDSAISAPAELAALENVDCIGITNGLPELLHKLADHGCNEVLVEAGARLVGSFAAAGLWDEWLFYIAPKLLGRDARSLADFSIAKLADAVSGKVLATTKIGADLRVQLRRG